MTPSEPAPCGHCEDNQTPATATQGGFSRRTFLAASATAGALATLPDAITNVAWGNPGDHTLVVISLRGGFDGLNGCAPVGDPTYHQLRPNIGVPQHAAIQLDNTFGLHPGLAALRQLWDARQLAVVHAVGQPLKTRSHFTAMAEMERAAPGSALRTGWIDRMVGQLTSQGSLAPLASMQLNTASPSAQFGGPNREIAAPGLRSLYFDYAHDDAENEQWAQVMRRMYRDAPGTPNPGHRDLLSRATQAACNAVVAARAVRQDEPVEDDREFDKTKHRSRADKGWPSGPYTDHFTTAMMDVGRLIRARVGLRVVAVDLPGWDMHSEMSRADEPKGWQMRQYKRLGDNLAALARDVGPAHWDNMTVITLSEFGRRAGQNGNMGTDHGQGNAVFVAGGKVHGKQLFGHWPGLAGHQLVDGDLATTTDYRVLVAEILSKRMGIGNIGSVFPNIPGGHLGVLR